MGLLDMLEGSSKKEVEELRKELGSVKKLLKDCEFDRNELQKKNVTILDQTHSFMQKLKLLVSTLEDEYVMERSWDLLESGLGVTKGAIYSRGKTAWGPEHAVGFKEGIPPEIPFDEESMPTYSAKHGVILSLAHLRQEDDLGYLERRGVLPDIKIACPVRVEGNVERLILICNLKGNVFTNQDDLEIVQMISTVLGLVLTNTLILSRQRAEIDQQKVEVKRLRNLFSRMVSPEIIEFIEKNPGGIVLGGNRQEIAILFADIRGFTPMSEKQTPERIIELLNRFFTLVTEVTMKTRGTLDKFMGDAAMILFGTPVPLENPARSAVRAGTMIQEELKKSMEMWVMDGFPRFGIGIGINFQSVVVGNVGSERLSNFTAIGDGVNLASRLCSIAKPGEIIISTSTKEKLGKFPEAFEARHGITVKGKAEPISVYVMEEKVLASGVCPQCGVSMAPDAKFCGKCGYRHL